MMGLSCLRLVSSSTMDASVMISMGERFACCAFCSRAGVQNCWYSWCIRLMSVCGWMSQ